MKKIVLCFPVTDQQVETLRQVCDGYEVVVSSQTSVAEDILDATIFCGHAKCVLDWERIVAVGKLQWIQSTAAGLDHCLHPAVIASDIVVSGASGLFARQVAEQTMALLFGLLRGLPAFFRAQDARVYERLPTDELQGKTVGILGLGGNGRQIATCLRPFDCRILATDFFADRRGLDGVTVYPPEEQSAVLVQSEVLIVTLPLLPETHRVLGTRELGLLPPNAYLVNVGRGQLLDESAMIHSLQKGHLRGAGLDVAFDEPLSPGSPLWSMPNVIITPHVGAQSAFRVPDTVRLFCDNFARWKRGEFLLNWVDKKLGFPRPEHRVSPAWIEESRRKFPFE